MRSGMLMNGSHGAREADAAGVALMQKIMAAVAQTLTAAAWYGLQGDFTVVLNLNDSRVTHVRTFAQCHGQEDRFAMERYKEALGYIQRICEVTLRKRLPASGYFGSVTIDFTHANGIVTYAKTTFGNTFQIEG